MTNRDHRRIPSEMDGADDRPGPKTTAGHDAGASGPNPDQDGECQVSIRKSMAHRKHGGGFLKPCVLRDRRGNEDASQKKQPAEEKTHDPK